MATEQAQATGTLGGTPIANLLVYVLDRRLTGTLVVEDLQGRKSAVAFLGGAPTKVRIPEPVARLSEVLVQMAHIDAVSAETTYEAAVAEQRLHGEILTAEGLIEPGVLADSLAEQVALKVEWLCTLPPETRFGYYDGRDYLQNFGASGANVEPLEVIWRAVRLQTTADAVDATLARLGSREIRLHQKSRVGRFGFTPRERGVVDVLRARPQPLPDLLASELLPEPLLKKVLYVLVATRHLDLGGAPPIGLMDSGSRFVSPTATVEAAPMSVQARHVPQPAAAPASADGAAFRAELLALTESLATKNHYEILGVDPGATASVVQGVFFQLAKKWHPDRIGPEFADVRDQATRVFSRMSEAHRALSNEELRREYDQSLGAPGEDPEEQAIVERVLRAASNFQKAEMLAKHGNLEEAEKLAASAVTDDPEQAEYLALHADLRSQQSDRARTGAFSDVIKMVNDAKKLQPDNTRVRLYRARVLKRSGDLLAAHREFRSVVEADAHNVEAAREVRLYEMRRGKTPTGSKKTPSGKISTTRSSDKEKSPSEIGQLFGKLFKR